MDEQGSTAAWDGRPKHPERDGWHWIAGHYSGADMQAMFWRAAYRDWQMVGKGYATEAEGMRGWRYVQPCALPEEVTRLWERAAKAEKAAGTWLNATADARQTTAKLRQAISVAIDHIDQHMGDTDPQDPEHPLLLAMQALLLAMQALTSTMPTASRADGREESNEGDRLDDSGIYSDGTEGKA